MKDRMERKTGRTQRIEYRLLGVVGKGTYGVVYKARSRITYSGGDVVPMEEGGGGGGGGGGGEEGEQQQGAGEDRRMFGWEGMADGSEVEVAIKEFTMVGRVKGVPLSGIREITLLRELDHVNIIKLVDVVLDPPSATTFLIFEYIEYDLEIIEHFHFSASKPLSPECIKSTVWQILCGLDYLHSNWIMHRDMKPANVLVGGAGKTWGHVKIGDFGMARVFRDPAAPLCANNPVVATLWYRAPELVLGAAHYTTSVDMWAVGCILAELLFMNILFKGKQTKEGASNPNVLQEHQLKEIISILGSPRTSDWPEVVDLRHAARLNDYEDIPSRLDSYLEREAGRVKHLGRPSQFMASPVVDLIKRLLVYNPKDRISASDALAHQYFSVNPAPSHCIFSGREKGNKYPKRKFIKDLTGSNPSSTTTTTTATSSNVAGRKRGPPPPGGPGSHQGLSHSRSAKRSKPLPPGRRPGP